MPITSFTSDLFLSYIRFSCGS